jgi:hypothetical protein
MLGRIKVSVAAGSNLEPATAATELPGRQTEQLAEEIVWAIEVFRQAQAADRGAGAVPLAGLRVIGAAVPLERAVHGELLAWVVLAVVRAAADGGGN